MYPTVYDHQKNPIPTAPNPPPDQFSNYPPPSTGIPVASNLPPPHHHHEITAWSSGLCGCGHDPSNCCLTCWCPCITFGQISEIVDQGSSSCGANGALYALINYLTGCAFCLSCFYRTRLRRQYYLEESPCGDCLVHFCCEQCALCQEYRELKSRGFDMSIGWHANVQRQNHGLAPPGVQNSMSR